MQQRYGLAWRWCSCSSPEPSTGTAGSWKPAALRDRGYYSAPYLASAGPTSRYPAVGELALSPGAVEIYGAYPTAVTFSADGKQLIVGVSHQDQPILVFDVGSTTPRLRTGSGFVPQRGVAANRNGTRIGYVASPWMGGPLTLRVAVGSKG